VPLSSGVKVLSPCREAAGVADAMIKAEFLMLRVVASLPLGSSAHCPQMPWDKKRPVFRCCNSL